MTGSARGTADAPGRNVAAKAGLNRSILDAAPTAFLNMIGIKRWWLVQSSSRRRDDS
ncbi:hypothetical protein [Rhodovulum adriaticum]|uniref:hypothetical protein n=1 Tax=Rhodovulum adriaticum TaxID=35804 RepID=UPI00190328DF|nr:hypothetical protein [Rhodovulum adriaticum]